MKYLRNVCRRETMWNSVDGSKCRYTHSGTNHLNVIFRSDKHLTLIPLTWRIWWAPNKASRWQVGFNLAFKGLTTWVILKTKAARSATGQKISTILHVVISQKSIIFSDYIICLAFSQHNFVHISLLWSETKATWREGESSFKPQK